MSKILKIRARQVFDSRGNPTIEAEVYSKNLSASAICPSGASTGTYEAFEKRDNSNKKYLGKSVLGAVNLVNTKISKKLIGANIHDQTRIDTILINLVFLSAFILDAYAFSTEGMVGYSLGKKNLNYISI